MGNRSVGELINKFDNLEINNVETFNDLFFFCPIEITENIKKTDSVEILEKVGPYGRLLSINNELLVHDFNPVIRNGVEADVVVHGDVDESEDDDWMKGYRL